MDRKNGKERKIGKDSYDKKNRRERIGKNAKNRSKRKTIMKNHKVLLVFLGMVYFQHRLVSSLTEYLVI